MIKNLKKNVMPAVGLTVGAVGAGFVSKYVPIGNDKIKAAAPMLVGLFLMGKKGIIGDIGAGMIAGGGLKLAQSFGIGAMDEVVDLEDIYGPGEDSPLNGPGNDGVLSGGGEDGYTEYEE